MDQLGLGPNGGLVYCMEYLEAHVEEIILEKINLIGCCISNIGTCK